MTNKNQASLVFIKSALIWLLLSGFLLQLRSLELIFPRFCADFSFLSFGKVDAAAEVCFLYGWGSCVAFAVGWTLSHPVDGRWGALLAFFWNLSLAIGVGLILGGETLLGLPSGLTFFLLFLSFFLSWPVLTACSDNIALRWLFASFFFLPWLLFTGGTLLREGTLKGAARLPVEAWVHEGLLWFWLGGSALAFAYYYIPKVLHTDLVEQRLAPMGFWMFFSVGMWASLRTIAGGAVPAWISAAGISANILLWVPIAVIWRNLCGTLRRFSWGSNPTLRFLNFGAHAFVLCSLQAIVLYSKSGAFLQFTDFVTSQMIFARYGFLTSIFCGALYHLAPHILLREWPHPRAIFWHFHLHRMGIILVVVALAIGGAVQGTLLNHPTLPFSVSVSAALPWRSLASLGWSLFFLAQIIFALHFVRLCGAPKKESEGSPLRMMFS